MRLVHRGPGLLELQEQRVGAGAALKEHQVHPHADAADPHDLTDDVGQREPVEQGPPVALERLPVPGQQLPGDVGLLVVADRDPDRRVLGDPRPSVCHLGELGERPPADPPLALPLDVDGYLVAVGRLEVPEQALDAGGVVPDVELGHGAVAAHPPLVGVDAGGDRRVGCRPPDPVLPRRHDDARRESLYVPLEGAGQGLVEVAQVEGQVPLRCGPQPEVEHVRVTAQLHRQPAVRLGRQVGGHHRGGAAVVVPRRDRHPLVADGDQLGNPELALRQDRPQRVVPAVLLGPLPESTTAYPLPPGPARRAALVAGRRQVRRRGRRPGSSRRAGLRHRL